jgi:hypothetical protein
MVVLKQVRPVGRTKKLGKTPLVPSPKKNTDRFPDTLNLLLLLLHPGRFTRALTEIKEFCPAYAPFFNDLDF